MNTILGLSIPLFTDVHVAISLIGIVAGLLFLLALGSGRWSPLWNRVFLIFTILTSVTGFFFPRTAFTPAQGVRLISLGILALALLALYGFKRHGIWRPVYATLAAIAQWFNVFVLIVQSFLKIPALHALAPGGNEPPFLIAQGIGLVVIGYLGWRGVKSRA